MGFEHGCFISYMHASGNMMKPFIEDLVAALKGELEALVPDPVYFDEDRLKPGIKHEPALGRGLCASACWIIVYVPQYSEHDYCMREFRAMQILEERRKQELGMELDPEKGMIVPILLRGNREELPAGVDKSIYLEFNHITVASPKITKNRKSMEEIRDLATYIRGIFELGKHLTYDCRGFEVPQLDGNLGFTPIEPQFPGHTTPEDS
jgi:hypothetical protein